MKSLFQMNFHNCTQYWVWVNQSLINIMHYVPYIIYLKYRGHRRNHHFDVLVM